MGKLIAKQQTKKWFGCILARHERKAKVFIDLLAMFNYTKWYRIKYRIKIWKQ